MVYLRSYVFMFLQQLPSEEVKLQALSEEPKLRAPPEELKCTNLSVQDIKLAGLKQRL